MQGNYWKMCKSSVLKLSLRRTSELRYLYANSPSIIGWGLLFGDMNFFSTFDLILIGRVTFCGFWEKFSGKGSWKFTGVH